MTPQSKQIKTIRRICKEVELARVTHAVQAGAYCNYDGLRAIEFVLGNRLALVGMDDVKFVQHLNKLKIVDSIKPTRELATTIESRAGVRESREITKKMTAKQIRDKIRKNFNSCK